LGEDRLPKLSQSLNPNREVRRKQSAAYEFGRGLAQRCKEEPEGTTKSRKGYCEKKHRRVVVIKGAYKGPGEKAQLSAYGVRNFGHCKAVKVHPPIKRPGTEGSELKRVSRWGVKKIATTAREARIYLEPRKGKGQLPKTRREKGQAGRPVL